MTTRPADVNEALDRVLFAMPINGREIIEYVEDLEAMAEGQEEINPVNSQPITGSSVPSSRHPHN